MKSPILILFLLLFLIASACQDSASTTTDQSSTKEKTAVNQLMAKSSSNEIKVNNALPQAAGMEKRTIPSKDGLEMTLNLWHQDPKNAVFVLCHQAGSSKEEYDQIAKKLTKEGYNCMALDQRSGGDKLGGDNETAKRAEAAGKSMIYLEAEQDIVSGIDYAHALYKKDIILVGSSYSASLALKIGNVHDKVKAVAVFSPGEYFPSKSPSFIQTAMKNFSKPLFISSSKSESLDLKKFLDIAKSDIKVHHIPKYDGVHGARALWGNTDASKDYWAAFNGFLAEVLK